MNGYLRADGRKGIRNVALVVYLVECAHFVATEIGLRFRGRDVQVIGFGLVGEIIIFSQAKNLKEYRIERIYE